MRHLRWVALALLLTSVLLGTAVIDATVDPCIKEPPHDFGCPETNPLRAIVLIGGAAGAFVLWVLGTFFSATEDR